MGGGLAFFPFSFFLLFKNEMHVVIKMTITTVKNLYSFDTLSFICYSPVSRVYFPYLTMKLFSRLAVLKQLACECIMI